MKRPCSRPILSLIGWSVLLSLAACSSNTDDDATAPRDASSDPPDAGEVEDSGVLDMGTSTSKCEPPGPELAPETAPIRRGDMVFAYDLECERIIMFFGDKAEPVMCGPSASDFLNDGFVFDPARGTWAEIPEAAGDKPLQRARGAATWDPTAKRMYVFGGRYRAGTTGAYTFLNDLWSYDPSNNTWAKLADENTPNAPSGRMNTVLVMDPDRNRVLVHDGGTTDLTSFIIDQGVWSFDLAAGTWEKLAIGGTLPSARIFHTAALDRQRSRLYIYGGGGADAFTGPFYGDAWYLDLEALAWTEVTSAPFPDGRIKGVMDYDAARDRMVLFAGHDNSMLGNNNDLWTLALDTVTWTHVPGGDTFNRGQFGFCDFPADFATIDPMFPERRESHLFSIHGDDAFLYGGRTDCGLSNDTWRLDLPTLQWQQINQSFNGMTCFRSGRTDCDNPDARKCG